MLRRKTGLLIFITATFGVNMATFHNDSFEDNGIIGNDNDWSLIDATPRNYRGGALERRNAHMPGTVFLDTKGKIRTGRITVGTDPAQNLDVIFDTSSLDSWLASVEGPNPKPLHPYNPGSSAKNLGTSFTGRGLSVGVNGVWYSDVFDVGGSKVTGMHFGSATEQGNYKSAVHGVIGLAVASPGQFHDNNFFRSVIKQHGNMHKAFAFHLGPDRSEFHLGGIDSVAGMRRYQMAFIEAGMAGLEDAEIFVNDSPLFGAPSGLNIRTVFNSGSPQVLGPLDHVHALYQKLGGQQLASGTYILPCHNHLALVSVSWGGDNNNKWEMFTHAHPAFRPDTNKTKWCRGIIQAQKSHKDLWILGLTFFQDKYVAFDFDKREICIARTAR